MPNRIIREGILTSPRMAKLGWPEEVFYRRLHSVVDDFGRYYADVGLLRAGCYPRQLTKVSDSDIGKWLRACVDAALVRVYPAADGESYLEVLGFGQQIRAKKSKFPDELRSCVADAQQLESNAHLDVSVSEDVFDIAPKRNDVSFDAATGAWSVPDALQSKWLEAYPAVNIDTQLAAAAAWLMANPKNQKSNYARFLGNWLGRAQEKAPRVNGSNGAGPEDRIGKYL